MGKRSEPAVVAEALRRRRHAAPLAEPAGAPVTAADDTTRELLAQLEADPEDAGTLAVVADQLQARGDVRGELITIQLALAGADRAAGQPMAASGPVGGAARGVSARGGGVGDRDGDGARARDSAGSAPDLEGLTRRRARDSAGSAADLEGLTRRRARLLAQLAPPLDRGDRAEWGVGFLRRLELHRRAAARLEAQRALWHHPSVRLVQELALSLPSAHDAAWLARLAEVVPRAVRRLELAVGGDGAAAELPVLLAALPHLEALALDARVDHARLAHPRLARLALGWVGRPGEPALAAARLLPDALPSLVSLSLAAGEAHVYEGPAEPTELAGPGAPVEPAGSAGPAGPPVALSATASALAAALAGALGQPAPAYRVQPEDLDEVCALLAVRWLGRLTHLSLTGGALSEAGVAALERGLAGRRLCRLELLESEVPLAARARLARLCDELVFPVPARSSEQAVWAEHAGKPEWGRGEIVRRFDGKLEVRFPGAGLKVFKASAPFLRLGA